MDLAPSFFGSRREREDATFIDQMVSFTCQGKIWTLIVEDARTTTYRRRGDERYLRTKVMIGANPPAVDVTGELLPRHTAARVTSTRRGGDGSYELILAVPLGCGEQRAEQAA